MKTDRVENEPRKGALPEYVVVTPAWNEAALIGKTLESMIRQTVPPLRWVIVSDGSSDGTDDIVKRYAAAYPWIELVRIPERSERHFAAKVEAFNAGYARLSCLAFDLIGNVDADITFDCDHFNFLLARFTEDPTLGVAGTAYIENSVEAYNYDIVNIEDVSGACQIFRRRCFEEIGGYLPIEGGGVDLTAVCTARMKGWHTRTFTEKTFVHNRRRGTGQSSLLLSFFRNGKQDYYLGGHPVWEILRSVYHMRHKPYFFAGGLLIIGYLWAYLTQVKRPVSSELVAFRRKEQMQRLRAIIFKTFFKRTAPAGKNKALDSKGT